MIWLMWHDYISWWQYLGTVIVIGFHFYDSGCWADEKCWADKKSETLNEFRGHLAVMTFMILIWPLLADLCLVILPFHALAEFVKWIDPTKRMYKSLEAGGKR